MEELPLEEQFEPVAEPAPEPGIPWGALLATLGLVLLVVFAVQNTEEVPVEFLWMSGQYPLSIVILVTAVAAGLLTTAAAGLMRRRRRRRLAEQHELRQLRGEG